MKSITRQKSLEEIEQQLEGLERAYLVGCGTCATMTKTGGRDEVLDMKERLQGLGKMVTGWTVIPTACDEMTEASLKENEDAIRSADCLLVLSCALGVQRVGSYNSKPVIPALDTLFMGVEDGPGYFHEVCDQCGHCVLGYTAGICPITACHKGLLNGPCGGTDNGKCEIDKERDCAWTLIYQRLKEQGRLDLMRKYQPVKNSQVIPRPRVTTIS
ncbi:MAG: 5,10-methylenetetrahydrofolate reductase [Dehalococcoidia bacterium]|nr:MAG: 5,10-methylenetetrahydrofolate reductase [Dehalococcoidia bacterium]